MRKTTSKLLFSGLLLTLCSVLTTAANASNDLKVCAGQNEMPFSNQQQQGFENDIAKVLANALNKELKFVWWKNPKYIGKHLTENKCDLIMGADVDDPRILATKPYYKSSYVFVTRKDREIDIASWSHPYLKEKNFRIGVKPDSPGKRMLLAINRFDDMFDYFVEIQNFKSTRNRYIRVEPARLVHDVENMHIHTAMLWGPEAARYVSPNSDLKMQVIEDNAKKTNGEKIPMHYEVVMGVSKNKPELRDAINEAIQTKSGEIASILKKEGIPLLPM